MRPCQLRSTGLMWTGVSPADGAACRRTPECGIPSTIAAELAFIFGPAGKTATLSFRHSQPYIRPKNAVAKGDPAGEPRPRSYAEPRLQPARHRIRRPHSPARPACRPRYHRHAAL